MASIRNRMKRNRNNQDDDNPETFDEPIEQSVPAFSSLQERRDRRRIRKEEITYRGENAEGLRIDKYVQIAANAELGFKSILDPDLIREDISDYFKEYGMKIEEDPKKYRLHV